MADYLEQESKQHRLKAQNLLLKTQKENIIAFAGDNYSTVRAIIHTVKTVGFIARKSYNIFLLRF